MAGSPGNERLKELADAYGTDATPDSVADAIIARTQISAGANERDPLIYLVALLTRDEGTIRTLKEAGTLTNALVSEMTSGVERFSPEMPPDAFVNIAIGDVRSVLQAAPSG